MKPTYCNPLSIEGVESGRSLDASCERIDDLRSIRDYRSISDPSVVYHDGKWIMYPSYALAYVTENFIDWKHVDIGIHDVGYSPAVVQFRGKWYLSGRDGKMYSADSPLGPFRFCGDMTYADGRILHAPDSCYLADGDRLYIYFYSSLKPKDGDNVDNITRTVGAECDPDEPWKLITDPVEINRFDPSREWQRLGEHNENERMGWIEGQWMIKIGSRYYLLYSGSGTAYGSYANGVAYSDEGPLSGFKPQANHDPFTEKKHGFLRGAGHGCIVEGPNNTYWTFYTSIFNYNFKFERRIGMDPVGIDKDGELFCPAVTDTPQFAPGAIQHPELGNDAGLLPLTFMLNTYTVSSATEGRDGIYALDDSVLTWWQPREDDPDKTLTVTLNAKNGYYINSIRIVWRDIGMEILDGIYPGPFKYVVEYQPPMSDEWLCLVDCSDNERDLCVDYRETEKVVAKKLRLRILGAPRGIQPAVSSFTAFGKCAH